LKGTEKGWKGGGDCRERGSNGLFSDGDHDTQKNEPRQGKTDVIKKEETLHIWKGVLHREAKRGGEL